MAQFDVVANPDSAEASTRPYLVVLQSELVAGLTSTIVAPLVPEKAMTGARHLNPVLMLNGESYWLATHELFAVDRRILRANVGDVADQRHAVIAALDFLFTGV